MKDLDMSKVMSSTPVVVYSKQVSEFVSQYRLCVQKTASAILELASVVKSAKDSLTNDEFKLFRQEIGANEAKDSYIKKLLCIAKESSRFADMSENLPPSYTTLYSLSQLNDDVFLKVCEDKVISPRMTASALSAYLSKKPSVVDMQATLSFKNVPDSEKSLAYTLIKDICEKFKVELKFNIDSPFSEKIKSLSDLNATAVPAEESIFNAESATA
jgi:hypothetical protein